MFAIFHLANIVSALQWRSRLHSFGSLSALICSCTAFSQLDGFTLYVLVPLFSDGLGRTGTFIAIWCLIEQLKAEGQIDVIGTIKSIRTQRPGAVPHLVRITSIQQGSDRRNRSNQPHIGCRVGAHIPHTYLHGLYLSPLHILACCPEQPYVLLPIINNILMHLYNYRVHALKLIWDNMIVFAFLIDYVHCSWGTVFTFLSRTSLSTAMTFSLSMWIHLKDTPTLMNKFQIWSGPICVW